jgi:C_GCAxxG_C_C family probable redox protein
MTKGDQAKELFLNGYNCAQAVLCAFCEDMGMNKNTALTASACFGGGLGRQREVCGAVSAMCMALSLKYAPKDPTDHAQKMAFYARVQEICRRFKEENGSIICRELLGLDGNPNAVHGDPHSPAPEPRTQGYYERRPCPDKCKSAADILEKYLAEIGGR